MIASLLSPDDARWGAALAGIPHGFYHLPSYTALEATRMGGAPAGLLVEHGDRLMFLPLVLREVAAGGVKAGARDASTPYGYPGWVGRGIDPGFAGEAVEAARALLAERGVISLFARLCPLLDTLEALAGAGTLVEHGVTVWIDLRLTAAELQKQLRPRYRSYLNKAPGSGLTVRFDRDFTRLEEFVSLYDHTMDRVSAADWYYFGRDYFVQLRAALGEHLHLCVVESGGDLVSAGLFAEWQGVVEYLFSGTDTAAGQPHASKLMMIFVRDWAKAQGHSVFHLGGGLGGGDDPLSQFKRGFSQSTSPFFTWRLVVDPVRYDEACAVWARANGVPADPPGGFFPAYRKPAAP